MRKCLLLLSVGGSVLITISAILVLFLANWLHVKHQPLKADAAMVLAGDPSRAFYAADLFQQGHVPHIYISKAVRLESLRLLDEIGVDYPRHEELNRQVMLKKGVPDPAISFIGDASISTWDEALVVKRELAGKIDHLLVITSPYHVRRVEMIFADQLPAMKITVVATPYETFPEQWWRDQNAARNVLLELAKIIFYQVGGRFQSG